jgi:hypothetical protein
MSEGFPQPGLNGTYRGSCAVCMHGTDTGLAFRGVAEWVIAGHVVLGIPQDQATLMVQRATGADPGMVPDGEITVVIRVCRDCAERSGAGFEVRPVSEGVPVYSPRH